MSAGDQPRRPLPGALARLAREVRERWGLLLLVYAPVALVLGSAVAARLGAGIAPAVLLRDPLQIVHAPFYTGILSNVGALLWAATAAICLFAWAVTRQRSDDSQARFLLAAGLLSTLLLVDDFFLLHEVVFPTYLKLPEQFVFALYATALLWFLARFRDTILGGEVLLLAVALGCLGFSMGVDLTEALIPGAILYLLEDGSKLCGIASWAAYFIGGSARHVADSLVPVRELVPARVGAPRAMPAAVRPQTEQGEARTATPASRATESAGASRAEPAA